MIGSPQMAVTAPEELTGEERLYRRYMDLQRIASDADAERREIRKEIDDLLDSGVFLGHAGRGLKRSYEAYVEFDWKAAVGDGAITEEVFRQYGHSKVKVVLRDASMADDEAWVESQTNAVRMAAPLLLSALDEAVRAIQDLDPAHPALSAVREAVKAAGGPDAYVAALKAAEKQEKKRK